MARVDRLSDEELVGRARLGDRRALDALLTRHADRVVAICRRVLADPDDARDAAQEALISVTRGIARFDGDAKFTTWLHRVATNAALDEARRRNRRPRPVEIVREQVGDGPSLASTVSDRIDIDAALAQLTPEFRAAVVLRDELGCDYAEIAEILGVPPGTVRSRIARGRAALADHLTPSPTMTTADVPADQGASGSADATGHISPSTGNHSGVGDRLDAEP